VRIPEVFTALAPQTLKAFGSLSRDRFEPDFYLIRTPTPGLIRQSEAGLLARWNMPVDLQSRRHPQKVENFIETSALALRDAFAEREPQGIFIGQLNPGAPHAYFKSLASNLRGRALQLFPALKVGAVEEQDPDAASLFCLVGKEGLFAGLQSPRACNGFYPGGSKFMAQNAPGAISRAGAKLAEALHYLRLYRPALPPGSHWLELGASPGGMTSELLAREQRVTAVDRAPLDERLHAKPGLRFIRSDVATFTPREDFVYDAILSDLNGPPLESMAAVTRLVRFLKPKGLVIFTLKATVLESLDQICALAKETARRAAEGGLRLIARTHLTYNRQEFTLLLERAE